MDPLMMAALGIGGLGALFGGSGGEYSKEQKRLMDEQIKTAKMMNELFKARARLTGPEIEGDTLRPGAMGRALSMAMSNARASQGAPRRVVSNTQPFDPYGALRAQQQMRRTGQAGVG